VPDRERDRLAVDVLDCGHGMGHRLRACAERNGERHGREHVRGVVFLIEGLVTDHRPARGFNHLDVETLFRIKAHRVRHDDRRGASDRNETHLKSRLLDFACALCKCLLGGAQREEGRDRRHRGARADCLEKAASQRVLGEERANDR
jgi:hypothetical protein